MKNKTVIIAAMPFIFTLGYGCKKSNNISVSPTSPLNTILFVGDSFTHGRYTPIRSYNSGGTNGNTLGSSLVYDENYGQTGARAELEPGPYGGIPGLFAEFAVEAGLNYDVHIEAISETSLEKNFAGASNVITQSKWNTVVLQELSSRPLPYSLTKDPTSNPSNFCGSVATIEKAVHGDAPLAKIFLYEPWPRADLARTLSGGDVSTKNFNADYAANLSILANANHNAYYSAAQHDGKIAGVAATGDAWVNAWAANAATANPYISGSGVPILWYGLNAINNPAITTPDYIHPSVYGAYLSSLVLFQKITGTDVRLFAGQEKAAVQLGISAEIAIQLQQIAWQSVNQENSQPINQSVDPCTIGSN